MSAADQAHHERAAWLFAATLHAPDELEAWVESAAAADAVTGLIFALTLVLDRAHDPPTPLDDAARRGLAVLQRTRLASPDLALVHAASAMLRWYGIPHDHQAARRRLLHAPNLAWRVEQAEDWLSIECEDLEWFAAHWFGETCLAIADALRPCVRECDPVTALRAGFILAGIAGDTDPVCTRSAELLAQDLALPCDPNEYILFRNDAARALHSAVANYHGLADARRLALAMLVEFDDPRAAPTIRALVERDLASATHSPNITLLLWIAEHRPALWDACTPALLDYLVRAPKHAARGLLAMLQPRQFVTSTLRAGLLRRFPGWTFDNGPRLDITDVTPDVLAAWREQLTCSEPITRDSAAVALAQAGTVDNSVLDALIDIFLAYTMPLAQSAWSLLQRPEHLDRFRELRRRRAATWRSPEHAADLLYLLSTPTEIRVIPPARIRERDSQ